MSNDLKAELESLRISRDAPTPSGSSSNGGSSSGGGFGRVARIALWLGVIAALGVGAAAAYPQFEAAVFKTEVTLGEVSTVSPAQAATSLTATGYVVPQVVSRVGSKIIGRIARVLVHEGDQVTAGQVIFELDRADQEAAAATTRARITAANARVAAAESRVATARANVVEIEGQIARQQTLSSVGASARQTLEDLQARKRALDSLIQSAQSDVRAAQADVRSIQAELAAQHVIVDQLLIRAPINGTVLTKPPQVGDAVVPEVALIEIADMTSLFVEVDVPEARLPLVRIGSPSEIVLDAFPGRRFRGVTAEIGHRVNRAKATLVVKARFVDDNAGVLPDMSARVSFLNEALTQEQMRAQEKAVVPAAAVTTRNGERVVFVVDDGVARMRRVRLGARMGDDFELIDGPDTGAKIVLNPPSTLSDGRKVKERNAS